MKRFDFRLERLLGVKKKLEQLAEQRQRQAQADLEKAMGEARRAEARFEDAGPKGLEGLRRDAALGAWQMRQEVVAVLGQAVTAANKHASVCLQRLKAAEVDRTRIATEVASLKHLRQEKLEAYRLEATRREYEQLDEVGMRRWLAGATGRGENDSPREDDR